MHDTKIEIFFSIPEKDDLFAGNLDLKTEPQMTKPS